MKKIAVILYGPPGSGKGTQADLLAKTLNLIHFDIGAYLESIVHDPRNRKNKVIQTQRKIFDSGGIINPLWVARLAATRIIKIARSGSGIIFSGSLRTLPETFGRGKTKGLLKVLEQTYGRKSIYFFLLKVKPASSIRRNVNRLICSVCGKPVLHEYLQAAPRACPVCGGPLRKRTLDDPGVIKRRLIEFKRQTEPVFNELKRHGYKIIAINGEPAPYLIQGDILKKLR